MERKCRDKMKPLCSLCYRKLIQKLSESCEKEAKMIVDGILQEGLRSMKEEVEVEVKIHPILMQCCIHVIPVIGCFP